MARCFSCFSGGRADVAGPVEASGDARAAAGEEDDASPHVRDPAVEAEIRRLVKQEMEEVHARMERMKGDLAKEMGYPLATRLIHEVSSVFDATVHKSSLRNQPNPWGWLQRSYEFKRALLDQSAAHIPVDMKSVEAISYKAAQIMAHSNKKIVKSYPEQLYMEIKSFRDKGYMDALESSDPDLQCFLQLSNFFATTFIARPRLLQLTSFMLQRIREELSIYWHTWDKLPFSWMERWHEGEAWFQAVIECFNEINVKGDVEVGGRLPKTIIDLVREFDCVEESTRRIYGANKKKEIGSFEQIIHQFEEMKQSELLTPQVARLNFVCYALLDNSYEIKARYIGLTKQKQHERKSSISKSLNSISGARLSMNSRSSTMSLPSR